MTGELFLLIELVEGADFHDFEGKEPKRFIRCMVAAHTAILN